MSVFAKSISLTFPVVFVPPDESRPVDDLCSFIVALPSSPEIVGDTFGRSCSGAGKARSEFADEGEREQSPRQFGAVSNTCSCCGEAVNV